MANGLNKVMLIGEVEGDPEFKVSPSGTQILDMKLKITEHIKGEPRTQWQRVKAFGKTAEALSSFLVSGRQVFVEGSLSNSSFTDNTGTKRHKTEVIAFRVMVFGPAGSRQQVMPSAREGDTDDIPF